MVIIFGPSSLYPLNIFGIYRLIDIMEEPGEMNRFHTFDASNSHGTLLFKGRLNSYECERRIVKILKPFFSQKFLRYEKRIAERTIHI